MIDNELVAQIAKAIQVKTGGNVEGKIPEWWAELIGMALAELQSAGRLIPAGGMALTAEQVEDVRTMLWSPGVTALPAFRRLRALFPATEPAEDGWGDVNPNDPQGRTYRETAEEYYSTPAEPAAVEVDPRAESQAACLYAKLLTAGEDPGLIFQAVLWAYERVKSAEATVNSTLKVPAPAEPAEEETKVEARITGGTCEPGELHSYVRVQVPRDFVVGASLNDLCSPEKAHELATLLSSPVVPAPTETGPWKTWQEVPDDTPAWSRDRRETNSWWWIRRTTERCRELRQADSYGETVHLGPTSFMNEFAPFVAAEER